MRRQAPVYGDDRTSGQFQGVHIPRAGHAPAIGGYTQYGGAQPRASRMSVNQPIILVNENGTPIRVDWCVGGCSLLNIMKIFLAEAVGTIILMFLGCSGIHGLLFRAITFGVAIAAATQIFGEISGAHINPAVTLASLVMGRVSLVLVPFYLIAQCLGAIIGYGLYDVLIADAKINTGLCVVKPQTLKIGVHPVDAEAIGFGLEFIMSIIYIMGVCSLWERAEQNGVDWAAPLKRGLLYTGIVLCANGMLSLNPIRASVPLIWVPNADEYHWIYWVGPILGSLLGACIYRGLVAMHKKLEARKY